MYSDKIEFETSCVMNPSFIFKSSIVSDFLVQIVWAKFFVDKSYCLNLVASLTTCKLIVHNMPRVHNVETWALIPYIMPRLATQEKYT